MTVAADRVPMNFPQRGLPKGWSEGLNSEQIETVLRRQRIGPRILGGVHGKGYRFVWLGKYHPYAHKSGKQYLHRYLVMCRLGRRLHPAEHVHHKNGDKASTDLREFEIMEALEHAHYHYGRNFVREGGRLVWLSCGEEMTPKELLEHAQENEA